MQVFHRKKERRWEKLVGLGLFSALLLFLFMLPIGSGSVAYGNVVTGEALDILGNNFNSEITGVLAWVGNGVMGFAGLFLWMAGVVLNGAVYFGVLQMGAFVKGLTAIRETWEIIRDLANIFFIFGLVAIGIATILEIEQYGIKKLLARLIVIALLINFSLFFTQVIVDASNILAAGIYQKTGLDACRKEAGNILSITCGDNGLSERIMGGLQLTTIYSTEKNAAPGEVTQLQAGGSPLLNDPTDVFLATTMGTIFILVATFIFLAMAIFLITRLVVLILLMILSPLAFIAMAIPGFQGQAKKWWGTLFNQAFFAPALFLMLYITIRVMESDGFLRTGNFANALSGIQGSMGVFLNYLIIIILIIASLIISKQMSAVGANTAVKWGRSAGIWGLKQAFWRRTTRPALGASWRWTKRKAAGIAERIEKAPEGSARQKLMDKFPVAPFVGRAARRGLQRTRAAYTEEAFKRQKEIETLRGGELDRRLKSASDHDFIALALEKARRNDLDEMTPEQLDRAIKLMGAAGMGVRPYKVTRPDVGDTERDIRANVKMQSPDEVAKMHRTRVTSIYNDDGTVKYGSKAEAIKRKEWLLGAQHEFYEGKAMASLFQGGGQNLSEYLKYAAERVGTTPQDPGLLHKIADNLKDINHARETGEAQGRITSEEARRLYTEAQQQKDLIERTNSTIRYLESTPAQRAAGMAPAPRGSTSGGGGGANGGTQGGSERIDTSQRRMSTPRETLIQDPVTGEMVSREELERRQEERERRGR